MILDATRDALEGGWNCRLTTKGRKTGLPRAVTIWFALEGDEVLLTGSPEGPNWLRNLGANPTVELEIAGHRLRGQARVIGDEAAAEAVRKCFLNRYLAARLARPFGGYTKSTAVRVAVESVEKL